MKKLVALLVFCFCFGSMAMANGLEGNGTLTEHTIKHKGIEYSYYLYGTDHDVCMGLWQRYKEE